MTASGQKPNSSRDTDDKPTVSEASAPRHDPDQDKVLIILIIAAFVCVVGITWALLAPNWMHDMTRYRSRRAQAQQDYPAAIHQLEKLIAAGERENDDLAAKSPTYLAEIAHSYLGMKKYDEALKYYELAQANASNMGTDDQGNPRPPANFQNMIGFVQMKLGNLDAATTTLQAALKVNKLDPLSNFSLGEIAMQKGNYIRAADYFKVVVNDPTYAEQVKKYYAEIEKKLFAGITA